MYRNAVVVNGDISCDLPQFLLSFLPVFVPTPMSLILKTLLWKPIKYFCLPLNCRLGTKLRLLISAFTNHTVFLFSRAVFLVENIYFSFFFL